MEEIYPVVQERGCDDYFCWMLYRDDPTHAQTEIVCLTFLNFHLGTGIDCSMPTK